MAFTFSLTVDWFKHRLLGANRVIKSLPADYFVEKHPNLSALPYLCHICGFSMAELILDSGWSIRSCSATGFKHILDNPQFYNWQNSFFGGDRNDLSTIGNVNDGSKTKNRNSLLFL